MENFIFILLKKYCLIYFKLWLEKIAEIAQVVWKIRTQIPIRLFKKMKLEI